MKASTPPATIARNMRGDSYLFAISVGLNASIETNRAALNLNMERTCKKEYP